MSAVCILTFAAAAHAAPPGEPDPSTPANPAAPTSDHAAAPSPAAKADDLPLGAARAIPARTRSTADQSGSRLADSARPVRGVGIGQVMGALGFVLALILIVFRAIRGGARAKGGLMAAAGPGGRAPSGVLSVLGRYPLARGQTLLLLKLDRRVLLVAQTVGSRGGPALATLTEVCDPEEAASIAARCEEQQAGGAKFHAELERYEEEHRGSEPGPSAAGSPVRSMRDRLASWRGAEPRGSAA